MWTDKQPYPGGPSSSRAAGSGSPVAPSNPGATMRPNDLVGRTTAWLGPSLEVKGKISGHEDLQIDGRVDGPISLPEQRLTVGRTAELTSEVVAREIIIYGKLQGNLCGRDRIEIKRDGSVIGDITTARVMIEDGAYFNGRIEIDRGKPPLAEDVEPIDTQVTTELS